jgi:hypothetical protein
MKTFTALLLTSLLGTAQLAAQTPTPDLPYQAIPESGPRTVYVPPAPNPPPLRPMQRLFNSHGVSCASDFNQVGCGNFWSEFNFIFGSCRTFFGETCTPNPYRIGQGGPETGQNRCCGK